MPIVTVLPGRQQVQVAEGETVLAGLARSGYSYTVGCRRGGCGICKVDLLNGTVRYAKTVADTVLTTQERQDGTCLSCRAIPDDNITIALRLGELRRTNPFTHPGHPPIDPAAPGRRGRA